MSKIKLKWVDMNCFSFQVETPQSKQAYLLEESKRIHHQVKRLNRNQSPDMFRHFVKTR